MAKGGSVSQSIDQKVYDLIHELLQERTEENKSENPEEDRDLLLHVALARDLRALDVVAYVQAKDFQLKRMKRAILEKSVDVVLKLCREDDESELAEVIRLQDEKALAKAQAIDSHFEGVDQDNLMLVPETNSLNKSVISMWEKQAAVSQDEEEKKAKKRSKEHGKHSKQKKPKIEHTPPSITLSSLGGLQSVTTQLMELVGLPILHPEKSKELHKCRWAR